MGMPGLMESKHSGMRVRTATVRERELCMWNEVSSAWPQNQIGNSNPLKRVLNTRCDVIDWKKEKKEKPEGYNYKLK